MDQDPAAMRVSGTAGAAGAGVAGGIAGGAASGAAGGAACSAAPLVVVMGVSGSGKSTVGRVLAQALAVEFLEGDALHSPGNVARMAAGVALTDADRQDWLVALASRLSAAAAAGRGLVVSCSALKRAYRDILRAGAPQLRLLYLQGAHALLAQRTAQRSGHFMPPSLLSSQLDTLQPPGADEHAIVQDIGQPPQEIVRRTLAAMGRSVAGAASPA